MRTRSGIYQSKRYDVNNGISVVNLCEKFLYCQWRFPLINVTLNQIFETEVLRLKLCEDIEKKNYLGT